jgi:Asp-tRNA(Asn)/Glu-tRNA(Gln) amidotransferase A subunit family amidase
MHFKYPALSFLCLALAISCNSLKTTQQTTIDEEQNPFSVADVEAMQKLIGLTFSKMEIDTLYRNLVRNLEGYKEIRKHGLENSVSPALHFDPVPENYHLPTGTDKAITWKFPDGELPANMEDLAFYPVYQLSGLIRQKRITSLELTKIYLDRIARYNSRINSVVTLTEKLALEQARRADEEIAAGKYRGPLHGIPYGVKDLLSVTGYKTTWGAGPYKDQYINESATVVQKLENAGAVLIAKLSTGELAYGDVWFGGRTLNPWDMEQGARGSSAGPAAATAAGLVAFSIGSETWGSIVSPSTRCGVTGLRPTFGRVSRNGTMTLSWSLDKVGPICRSALDCALVLDAIRGKDQKDRATKDVPYQFDQELDMGSLRVGILASEFEKDTTEGGDNNRETLAIFKNIGLEMEPVSLPDRAPYSSIISTIIRAESGAVFDQLILSNQDDQLARQDRRSRANSLRQSRFIPAAEYIQANRHRTVLIEEMAELFKIYDVIIAPTVGAQSPIGNLTGHPVISVPNGFDRKGRPTSIILMGRLFEEGTILALAHNYQLITKFDEKRPSAFSQAPD